jgi:hypothetical protein
LLRPLPDLGSLSEADDAVPGGLTAAQAALVVPELPSPTLKPVRQLG